jgi:hypothetical protein
MPGLSFAIKNAGDFKKKLLEEYHDYCQEL